MVHGVNGLIGHLALSPVDVAPEDVIVNVTTLYLLMEVNRALDLMDNKNIVISQLVL